ncbi:hypothetical protein M569_09599, partial [Genlisea aurea]
KTQRRRNCRRSQNGRPPRVIWQPTIPSWEKQFCRVVGSINWETVKERKESLHLYENVANWDDSAGKEAFLNAKRRYWAEINNLPCDVSMPDPDLYIDDIKWDSSHDDSAVVLEDDDDDIPPLSSDAADGEPVIIFSNTHLPPPPPYRGWGDDDEDGDFKPP